MQRILSTYSPISLDEMQGIKLMNRIDTKFVTTTGVLRQLLLMANGAYRVQEIGGERNMRYNTTYLDTPDYQMFYAHQWGHANRQKVRFRNRASHMVSIPSERDAPMPAKTSPKGEWSRRISC